MITHIKGKLVEKNPTEVVIECNGVGYFINISLHTFSKIGNDEILQLYTHLQVKEDSHTLYGFAERLEREIFRLLISVSGIGTSIARTMLSSLSPNQVKEALASGDVATIQSVKGIGAKTAQRVILDLKEKVLKIFDMQEVSVVERNTVKDEALSALETLGFNRKAAQKVVENIIKTNSEVSVEDTIKLALKKL